MTCQDGPGWFRLVLLQSGVMGVLTGLTRTLSRWSCIEKERQTGLQIRAGFLPTSSQFLESSRIQPSSMTSAESLVT
jgi:hypothetical protein